MRTAFLEEVRIALHQCTHPSLVAFHDVAAGADRTVGIFDFAIDRGHDHDVVVGDDVGEVGIAAFEFEDHPVVAVLLDFRHRRQQALGR